WAQFGMSQLLGPQSLSGLEGQKESRFIPGLAVPTERGVSERTLQMIDGEVADLLRRSLRRAVGVLDHNRHHLLALAARLREKEVIEGAELQEVLAGADAPPTLRAPDESAGDAPAIRHCRARPAPRAATPERTVP